MKRRSAISILLMLAASALAPCQTGPVRRRQSGTRSANPDQSTTGKVLPSFTGIVRGSDKKLLLLEQADQNTMQFFCTGKTHYFDGAKKIKASQIQIGDRVLVEARLGPDGKPEAVNVRLNPEEPPPSAGAPAQGDPHDK
jgi:hypothetical protein